MENYRAIIIEAPIFGVPTPSIPMVSGATESGVAAQNSHFFSLASSRKK